LTIPLALASSALTLLIELELLDGLEAEGDVVVSTDMAQREQRRTATEACVEGSMVLCLCLCAVVWR
jgi:hypothetical protein